MRTSRLLSLLCTAALLGLLPAFGASQVPTFSDISGHDVAERIALNDQIDRYLERLEATSDRVAVVPLGRSWEGRNLRAAIVTSPRNHARLDQIRETAQRLADPRRTGPEELDALLEDQPAILWIQGSIHGFELSGTEGMLLLLEHLTTRNDPETMEALENAVVLVEPLINPDGRDAFAHFNHQRASRHLNAERDDWNNDFSPWESRMFRTGHYFFDNNRDWTGQTQPVTRARVRKILEWRPQALIDAHEFTPDIEFFFPHMWGGGRPRGGVEGYAERWCDEFGSAFAESFDREGRPFTTREIYGCGFPGSVPASTTAWAPWAGAVGILFEQGSSRGLSMTRPDGTVRTLRFAAENQYYGAWALVTRAVRERERLLREYYESHRAFMEEDSDGIRRWVLPPSGDRNLRAEAVNTLVRNGIEVDVLAEAVSLGSLVDAEGTPAERRSFPAGSYVVEVGQPRVVSLLFEAGRSVTLPHLFNLEAYGTAEGRSLPTRRVEALYPSPSDAARAFVEDVVGGLPFANPPAAPAFSRAEYAYLIDGRQAMGLVAAHRLRDRGYRVMVSTSPLHLNGREYAPGTVVVRVADVDASVHEAVEEVAGELELEVRAEDTGLAERGYPSLGSASLVEIRVPEIALVAEDPVDGYSFGWAWFTLQRQHRLPLTVLRAGSIASTPLGRFDVIVLPELSPGAFTRLLGPEGWERLERWIRDGGSLVTLGSATEFARTEMEWIGLRSWYDTEEGAGVSPVSLGEVSVPVDLHPSPYAPGDRVPVDWMAAGYPSDRIHVIGGSSRLYAPPENPGARGGYVVATYGALSEERREAAGGWTDAAERFEGGVYAYHERMGAGRIVAFAEDPNYRAQARGINRLFLNAVLVTPSAR